MRSAVVLLLAVSGGALLLYALYALLRLWAESIGVD